MNTPLLDNIHKAGNIIIKTPDLLAQVKAASLDECKFGWQFFDDKLPRFVMDGFLSTAKAGRSLAEMYQALHDTMGRDLDAMSNYGRACLMLCCEFAIRTTGPKP